MQRASRDHDRAWLADHVGYLLRYHGSAVAVIRNRSDFLRNDETVVSDRLHNAVEMQGPERVFESGQGLMVGDGTHKMWLRESREGERALRDRDDHNEMR